VGEIGAGRGREGFCPILAARTYRVVHHQYSSILIDILVEHGGSPTKKKKREGNEDQSDVAGFRSRWGRRTAAREKRKEKDGKKILRIVSRARWAR